MSENRSGRKRHVVEGTVNEVKKTERAIGRRVGEKSSAMTSFRRFLKRMFKK